MSEKDFYTYKKMHWGKRFLSNMPFYNHVKYSSLPFLHDNERNTLSYEESCSLFSIYKENGITLNSSSYKKYESNVTSSEKTKKLDGIDLHILHLKNAYIIRGVGIFTEHNKFLHEYFSGRRTLKDGINNDTFITLQNIKRIKKQNVRIIEDDVFYFDQRDSGWGHFLIENVPRLWALKHIDKELLVATSVAPPVVQTCLTALGCSQSRPFHYGEVVFCKSLYVATQPWFLFTYGTQQARSVWENIGAAFSKEKRQDRDKIYISRKNIGGRVLINQDKIDDIFIKNGFSQQFPEKMTFSQQISMFTNASMIAAPYGSGIFGGLFAQQPTSLFIMASNEEMCQHFECFDEKWSLSAFIEPRAAPPGEDGIYRTAWAIKDTDALSEIVQAL